MTEVRAPGDDLLERLQAFVGLPAAAPVRARDPVNVPMIRHWCDALGDRNPVYTDADAARATGRAGVVAPTTMLQVWCMDRPTDEPDGHGAGGNIVTDVVGVLNEAGFTSVVATDYEQTYARELRLGDRLLEERTIEAVSPLKRTALGEGHFFTTLSTYRDESGDVVGTSRMRVLKFRPKPRDDVGAAAPATRPHPPVNRDNAFFWEGTARGELLIQRCAGCATLRHPPAPMCGACGSLAWDTVRASGHGTVHSWVVHHHPPLRGLDLPVTVLLVDLDEGVRLVADLDPADAGQVDIGMPVQVFFVRVDDDVTLPRFRRADA